MALAPVLVLGVTVWPLLRRPEPVVAVGTVRVEGLEEAVGTAFASGLATALAHHGTVVPVAAASHGLRVDATLSSAADGIRVSISLFAVAGAQPVWRASVVAARRCGTCPRTWHGRRWPPHPH